MLVPEKLCFLITPSSYINHGVSSAVVDQREEMPLLTPVE
jgi:hypothetical protein